MPDFDPAILAWSDQFGARLRDECREIQEVIYLTGWEHLAIEFVDSYDDDRWRLTYHGGHFWVTNLTKDADYDVELDLESLGVNRRGPV